MSTKSLMAALSDCFPSSSCLLLREYWNLVPSNISVGIKKTKIWLPIKTLAAHFLPQDTLRTTWETETLDACSQSSRRKRGRENASEMVGSVYQPLVNLKTKYH